MLTKFWDNNDQTDQSDQTDQATDQDIVAPAEIENYANDNGNLVDLGKSGFNPFKYYVSSPISMANETTKEEQDELISPSVFDLSKYIINSVGEISAMKLQKLTFYVKAWGLVWDEEEMFPEKFQAWANGAVSPALYLRHRGVFKVDSALFPNANPDIFTESQKETIDKVLEFYGEYTAQQLSDINHQEKPWIDAREDAEALERCTNEISSAAIAEYYSGVWAQT